MIKQLIALLHSSILRSEANGDVFSIHPWEPDSDQESSDMDEDSDSDEPDTGIMYQ